ncbi:MAG: type II secretion system F family protein [Candidatus Saccharimonadales bacterium]
MPNFSYTANNSSGKTVKGFIEADDKEAAIAGLKRQQLHPLVVTKSKAFNINIGGKKVKTKDVTVFTRQLSTMISAGVPLNRAFLTLQEQAENDYFKKVIGDMAKDIEGGASIGDAMGKYPKIFDDIFVNMVIAGEAGGILDEILKRLATQLEKNESIKKKIKSATTYPKVVFTITIGAFVVVMNVIVPKISAMLLELGGPDAKLPPLTRIMIAISDFSKEYALFIIIAGVIGAFLLRRYINTPKGKYKYHSLLLKLPVLKIVITKVAVARFARTFSSLMSAGVPVNKSIRITSASIGNKVLEKELMEAANDVEAGKQLSDSLAKSPHYPPIVAQMLAIGEETGQIDKILVKVADFYEEEVDATIEGLSSLLEPLMIVILGGMVGLVAASVMGPLGSLTSSLSK